VAIITAIAVVSAVIFRQQRNPKNKKDLDDLKDELKDLEEETTSDNNNDNKVRPTLEKQVFEEGILVKPIGTVNSIYRLCVGTPRQGLLAPDARGRIQLAKFGDAKTGDAVIGLEGYSHIWVLFCFHLNTQSKNSKRVKTKVAPPALGGKKVGILATRTPHRFNPIGITLCRLDKIEKKNNEVVLHVSGLDLVDGTPIFDIKPYVPFYDSVDVNNVKLPPWVPEGLSTRRNVTITQLAQEELKNLLQKNSEALQFYGKKHGDKSLEGTVDVVTECIRQVLAVDVRSSYQTKKAREGKFQAERSARIEDKDAAQSPILNICTQQLDNLLIQYTVTEAADRQNSQSEGSGAEDLVFVKSIQLLKTKEEAEAAMEKASEDIAAEEAKAREVKEAMVRGVILSSPKKQPPADSGDYPTLKKYWNEAATENPKEIRPTDRKHFQSSQKNTPTNGVASSSSVAAGDSGAAAAAKRLAEEKATEEAKIAEAKKRAEEKANQAAEQKRIVEAKAAEDAKLAEVNRITEEKVADEAKVAEAKIIAEEEAAKEADAKKAAEEARIAAEAETKKLAGAKVAEEARVAEEKRIAEEKAGAEKKLVEEKAAEGKKLADEKASKEKKLAEEKILADETAAKEKKLAEEKVANEKKVAEEKTANEKKLAEEKKLAAEKAASENKLSEEKDAKEKKLADEKSAKKELLAKEKKLANEKAAGENKLAEEKAAKEKSLADEKAEKEKELTEEKSLAEEKAANEKKLAEEKSIAEENAANAKKLAKEKKLAEEKTASEKELAEEKPGIEKKLAAKEKQLAEVKKLAEENAVNKKKLAEEKAAKEKKLADEKAAKEKKIAEEKAIEARKLAEANAAEAANAKATTKKEEPQVAEEPQATSNGGNGKAASQADDMVTCSVCAVPKTKSDYTKTQLKKKTFKCKECIAKQTS
jgi:tRNA-Thr(GGU) m(6)t(6)A37 methyltransferase TsaA